MRIGDFVLRHQIAMGGMAEIWAATPIEGNDPVALKVLQPHLTNDDEFRAMFRDEVHIALRLRHEHIVRVHDGRYEDGYFFLVMDLIEGLDLRRTLKRLAERQRWLPAPIALSIGQAMARALAYAHLRKDERGRPLEIIHRDISPHNVMLSEDGGVCLLDFGIARARARQARTRTGVVKGKVGYMAPEQAIGTLIDQRTDIFAMGIVLWEMLAMQRLFAGPNDVETMSRVVNASVPNLRRINNTVPVEAADLIHHMLAQSPRNRPASMEEVEWGLTRALALSYDPAEHSRQRRGTWMKQVLSTMPKRRRTLVEHEQPTTTTTDEAPTQPTKIP